jgi:hypothetical protein
VNGNGHPIFLVMMVEFLLWVLGQQRFEEGAGRDIIAVGAVLCSGPNTSLKSYGRNPMTEINLSSKTSHLA